MFQCLFKKIQKVNSETQTDNNQIIQSFIKNNDDTKPNSFKPYSFDSGTPLNKASKLSISSWYKSNVDELKTEISKTILVIDHDPITIHLFESIFINTKYSIISYQNFDDDECNFFASLIEAEQIPDLVFLDVRFYNVKKIIKNIRSWYPNSTDLPILLSASAKVNNNIHDYLALGANDFIYKPLRNHEVIYRINSLLQISQYNKKSSILRDVFPSDVILNLENGQSFMTKNHDNVTILFSDICSFTKISSELPTHEVINILNTMFCGFDDICIFQNVYKVETIGDAYMIAYGHESSQELNYECNTNANAISEPSNIISFTNNISNQKNANQVFKMVQTAKMMIDYVSNHEALKDIKIRIGIHTGPAYSGVIGKIRPRYCFFGDTVNIAARMESHGVPSMIHVTDSVMLSLDKEKLNEENIYIIDRNNINVKGKGNMHTFLLSTEKDTNTN